MSALLVQAPDSKVWHIALSDTALPICRVDERADSSLRWRIKGSSRYPNLPWRTPHGICSNCAREVESAVRLIAVEESH